MNDTLLSIENLHIRFNTYAGQVQAVNGMSFDVRRGEMFGLVGESGCGKSVTGMAILRMVPYPGEIVEGRIGFHDRDLLQISQAEMQNIRGGRIAMIFQDPSASLNPVFSIGNQITRIIRQHSSASQAEAEQRALESLRAVGLPNPARILRAYPHELSGGMQQRAMIAMALASDAELLIADEPTTALDVTIQAQIVDLVKRLQEELGMAVMWITHDLGVVADMAKTINVMYAGFIVERGGVRDVYHHPRHPYTVGLLGSLPRLDEPPGTLLVSIPGLPPDLLNLPTGCPFEARCPFAVPRCRDENPALEATDSPDHITACWEWTRVAERIG